MSSSADSATNEKAAVGLLGNISARNVTRLQSYLNDEGDPTLKGDDGDTLAVILFHGSWNRMRKNCYQPFGRLTALVQECNRRGNVAGGTAGGETSSARSSSSKKNRTVCIGSVQVDEDDESMTICVGDCEEKEHREHPCLDVPSSMPAVAVVSGDVHADERGGGGGGSKSRHHEGSIQFVDVDSKVLLSYLTRPDGDGDAALRGPISAKLGEAMDAVATARSVRKRSGRMMQPGGVNGTAPLLGEEEALRIFVSGDRANVGKSTVCLGLLGSLLRLGYPPESLGYIKPATQSEETQLVADYCTAVNIDCNPVGPVVYFSGFTRAFLAGETDGTEALLAQAGRAVDELANRKGKRVVIIDGVGYPSVGSICGTDNASVSRACGCPLGVAGADGDGAGTEPGSEQARTPAPVLLVGKSGVGDAVDSFNLNSTFFEASRVPVLGAVFNKLPLEGFYSLENCKREVTAYFDQFKADQRAFGFIPEVPQLAKKQKRVDKEVDSSTSETEAALDRAEHLVTVFSESVDVSGIVTAASEVTQRERQQLLHKRSSDDSGLDEPSPVPIRVTKKVKLNEPSSSKSAAGPSSATLTREQIESAAMLAGAAAAGG